jgi:hypothetical protein
MSPLARALGQVFESAADTSVSEGTIITASGSNNTKGSYTTLIAATAHPAGGMFIILGGANTSGGAYLIDLAIGAAASEQIIVPDLFYHAQADSTYMYAYLPISIPAGVRVSARVACSSASRTVRVNVVLVSGEAIEAAATAYGTDAANSRGTQVTASGSTNTKGSWTQLTAATTAEHKWCIVMMRSFSGQQAILDLGTGAGGSEQMVVPNMNLRDSSSGDPVAYAFPLRIPKGTRVAARCAATVSSGAIYVQLIMI